MTLMPLIDDTDGNGRCWLSLSRWTLFWSAGLRLLLMRRWTTRLPGGGRAIKGISSVATVVVLVLALFVYLERVGLKRELSPLEVL